MQTQGAGAGAGLLPVFLFLEILYLHFQTVCKGLRDKLWHQVNLRVSHGQLVVFCRSQGRNGPPLSLAGMLFGGPGREQARAL